MQDGAGTYHTDAARDEKPLAQDSPGDELFEGEGPKEMQARTWRKGEGGSKKKE